MSYFQETFFVIVFCNIELGDRHGFSRLRTRYTVVIFCYGCLLFVIWKMNTLVDLHESFLGTEVK